MNEIDGGDPVRAGRCRPRRPPTTKGPPKTVTAAAKDAIARAAAELGGHERIVAWVEEDPKHEAIFWSSIYPKLIPVQLSGEGGGPIEHGITIRFV